MVVKTISKTLLLAKQTFSHIKNTVNELTLAEWWSKRLSGGYTRPVWAELCGWLATHPIRRNYCLLSISSLTQLRAAEEVEAELKSIIDDYEEHKKSRMGEHHCL